MATRIKFQGFAAGADVVLSSEGQTASTGLSGWGAGLQTGDHSAQIIARRGELRVNPEGINFEVALEGFDSPGPVDEVNTYDSQFHNIYYFWDFGDPGSVFTAPQNVAAPHLDANRAYGPLASHTYQQAGTYTASVLVIEPSSGKMATASVDIVVGDAEVLFAGDRTIFVSTDETFARAPAGARTVATGGEAIALQGSLQSANATHMFRIMFDREVDHILDNSEYGAGSSNPGQLRDNYKNLWLCGAPGAGLKPVITAFGPVSSGIVRDITSNDQPNKKTDIVFHDIELVGYYDVQAELMGGPTPETAIGGSTFLNRSSAGTATYTLFNNVEASGFNTLLGNVTRHLSGDPDSLNVIFNNVSVTSWANFAIYEEEQGFTAFTGTKLTQDPLSTSGNEKSVGGTEHGPVRINDGGKCVMHSCDMFSRNGWFPNFPGMHSPQPCVRWNQHGNPRGKLNIQGSSFEAGLPPLAFAPQDSNYPPAINNMLVDKTTVAGHAFSSSAIKLSHSGATVRNCVIVHAGERNLTGVFNVQSFIEFQVEASGPDYLAAPNRVYSNTLINQVSDAESQGGSANISLTYNRPSSGFAGVAFTNVIVENNVVHQPNLSTPDTPFAPLATDVLFEPRFKDYRDFSATVFEDLTVEIPDGGSIFFDYSKFAPYFSDQVGTITRSLFDENPTNPANQHKLSIADTPIDSSALSFAEAGVTITNQTGIAWTVGQRLIITLTTASLNIRPEYGTPSDAVISAAPLPGSPAIGAALSGLRALDDFYGNPRPEYASIGAFEVPK